MFKHYKLEYPEGFEQFEWELQAKGWFGGASLIIDGRVYPLTFFDPMRLSQDVQDTLKRQGLWFERNLVVVPSVTREHMEAAAATIFDSGEYLHLAEPQDQIRTDLWQLEQVLVLTTIGILTALQRETISCAEATALLFHRPTLTRLARPDIRAVIQPKIRQLMEDAENLLDLESMLPELYPAKIDELLVDAFGCLEERRPVLSIYHRWIFCLTGRVADPDSNGVPLDGDEDDAIISLLSDAPPS